MGATLCAMWNPDVYLTFADHRGRPFFDLTSRVAAENPRRVVDLGCGPGNLTATLAQRWPDAAIEALDSSPEMVESARERGVDAQVGDVAAWEPKPDTDVVVSNATLQWLPEHRELLVRWAGQLRAWLVDRGADAWQLQFAVARSDSHRCASRARSRTALRDMPFPERDRVSTAAEYAELLTDAGCRRRRLGDHLRSGADRREPGAGVDVGHRAAARDRPVVGGGVAAVPPAAHPDARRDLSASARRRDVLPVPPDLRCRAGAVSGALVEQFDHLRDEFVDVGAGGVEHQIGVLGCLVRRVDAGEPLELTCAGPRVKALRDRASRTPRARSTRGPR